MSRKLAHGHPALDLSIGLCDQKVHHLLVKECGVAHVLTELIRSGALVLKECLLDKMQVVDVLNVSTFDAYDRS